MKHLPYMVFGGLLLLQTACQPQQLAPEALNDYVFNPQHHLQQVQQVGDIEAKVTYQPVDLLVARDLPSPVPPQPAVLDSLRHRYRGTTYFLLALARHQHELLQPREGFAPYSNLLQTLAFEMPQHVRLVTSQGDTLRPSNYYFDRTYAGAAATQLLFAFPTPTSTGTWCFQLQECGLGIGNLSFPFAAAQLATAPTLAN